jgi:DNA processing protein
LDSHAKYWLGFSLIPNIGGQTLLQLFAHFRDLSVAWYVDKATLLEIGYPPNRVNQLIEARAKIDLDAEMDKLTPLQATLITWQDAHYPEPLREIHQPPPLLYVRGNLLPEDQQALAIIGTRKATHHGRQTTYELSKRIAKQGVTIVSGLALGIDTSAHLGALDAGGRTIAVFGNGIDRAYPQENRDLARRIVQQGAVISEFPIGTPPQGKNFPRRNRLISGLSMGVLVTEAPMRSGSLITATYALEQGREVFAVPANIYNQASAGTNRLLQEGAKLVMNEQDILDELQIQHKKKQTIATAQQIIPDNPAERVIFDLLTTDPIHIDDLVRLSGLSIADVGGILTFLELKGLAETVAPMQYSRVRKLN